MHLSVANPSLMPGCRMALYTYTHCLYYARAKHSLVSQWKLDIVRSTLIALE